MHDWDAPRKAANCGVEEVEDDAEYVSDVELATPLMQSGQQLLVPRSLQLHSLLRHVVPLPLLVVSLLTLCYWSAYLIFPQPQIGSNSQMLPQVESIRVSSTAVPGSQCSPLLHSAPSPNETSDFYQHTVLSASPRSPGRRPARHFVSFGAGAFSAARIGQEAVTLGLFDTVTIFNDTSAEWKAAFPVHTYSPGRGYGFWYWKSRVIQWVMEHVAQPDDLVLYVDGGCTLGRSYEWSEWFSLVQQRDLLAFRLTHLEQLYTKYDAFHHFGLQPDEPLVALTPQIHATFTLWRNTAAARSLLCSWLNLTANFHLISEEMSSHGQEHANFKGTRHDQSLFSLLLKTQLLAGNIDALVMDDPSYPIRESGQAVAASRRRG